MILSILIASFIISWITFSINQLPEWEGTSSSGLWKTTFEDEYSPKGFWNGFFTWNGEETVTVTKVSLTRNNIEIHGWEKEETMNSNTTYNYLTTTTTFNNREDEYILTIYWNDRESQHREEILLLPKKRYFVFPTFLLN